MTARLSFGALSKKSWALVSLVLFMSIASIVIASHTTYAQLITTENPRGNAIGIEGQISAPPPTQGGRITSPSGGQTYTTPLITVSGICPNGLLVEVLSNGVLVGSTLCERGSFSVQIQLFPGQNDLTVRVLDNFGQAGPASNTVTVTYSVAQFSEFAQSITLTSAYSRRSADPGSTLLWPIQLSGGSGPYAISIDWGDGTEIDLQSQAVAGLVQIKHIYNAAGIYKVTIRVSDSNGAAGFLQLIAVANGAAESGIKDPNATSGTGDTYISYWQFMIVSGILIAMLVPAFWLGGRYQLRALRQKFARDAELIHRLND